MRAISVFHSRSCTPTLSDFVGDSFALLALLVGTACIPSVDYVEAAGSTSEDIFSTRSFQSMGALRGIRHEQEN